MPVRFIAGNILNTTAMALVNPVNCVGVMGAGLAKDVKAIWPSTFHLYKHICERRDLRPGWLIAVNQTDSAKRPQLIIHLATKDHWRDPSRLDWILDGMDRLAKLSHDIQLPSIAIPALGCGHGGLQQDVVVPRLEERAHTFYNECDVQLYMPVPPL